MRTLKFLLGTTRPSFLLLTPACVSVGAGTAFWQTRQLNAWHILLVLVGSVSAHISVNVFNEYFDYKSGLDARTRRTPFSGGSGTLPAHPEITKAAFLLAWTTFIISAATGVTFVWLQGWQLLPIGLFGLILLVSYTVWWTYHPLLCLIAPGIGFGLLMVMGTHFALTGTYSWPAFVASLVPTCLVADLLLLNQFPDVEADRSIGRRHFPITVGRRASADIYGILLLSAYLAVISGVWLDLLPGLSLISLLTAVPGLFTYRRARRYAENIPALQPAMGMNVLINIATPLLLAAALFIASAGS